MPRKDSVQKHPVVNGPVYGSPLVSQLVNKVLLNGRKSTVERIVYGTPKLCEKKAGTDPVLTLKCAIENVKPTLEIRSRRVGGTTYQVPVGVRPGHGTMLVLCWLLMFSRQHRESAMIEHLANEILNASNGLSASVKRREDTHKMAGANHALAYYRWQSLIDEGHKWSPL